MRTRLIILLLITINIVAYGQSDKTSQTLLKEISTAIEARDTETLWSLGSESFKTKISKENFENTANAIYTMLSANEIEKLADLNKNQSTTLSFINGVSMESSKTDFYYLPFYFGEYTNSLFINSFGNRITIGEEKLGDKWFLSDIVLDSAYLDTNYDFVTLTDNLSSDDLIARFGAITADKMIYGKTELKKDEVSFLDDLGDLKYINHSELKLRQDTSSIFCISVYKANSIDDYISGGENTPSSLEFAFFDNGSNIVMISCGREYAFYEMNNLNDIKEFILKELKTLE